MEIDLDKFELNLLEALREKTGKSDEDLIKMAIFELYKEIGVEKEPNYIPYPFPIIPQAPVAPHPDTVPWKYSDQNPAPYPTYPAPQPDIWLDTKGINTTFTGENSGHCEFKTNTQSDFSEISPDFKI